MRAINVAWLLFATLAAAQLPPESAPVAVDAGIVATTPAPAPGWAPVIRNGTCAFVYTSPRFFRVEAEITLQGVRTDDVLLNDALIRALRAQLKLSPCQVGMSQGTNCTSGTQQLPCSDPVFNCGQGVVISEDVYNAAINGDCATPSANNTLVCNTIAANSAISAAVSSGSCRPACLSGSAQATQEFPIACTSYLVSIDAPDKAAALVAAASLGNTTLQTAVSVGLSSYSNGLGIQFLVVNSDIEFAVGYGFFPPPPPPMVPIETPTVEPVNATAVALAAAGTLVYGPWSPCAPSCGDGYSTRTATCFAPDGTLLPLQACPGGVGAETYQPCS
jgi:Thrombospondin type 1 domain